MSQTEPKTIRLTNSIFLTSTALLSVTAVPAYIWAYGLDGFQIALFLSLFIATGLSITLGYHRLFSHLSFKAKWPVKLSTLVFGAATFENSALCWCADHRDHHKHVDHDKDPYNISNGFFHAHIGWIMFKNQPTSDLENVKDLAQDPLVMWQHKNYIAIALIASFVFPALLGFLWNGWVGALGALLIGGVARVFAVHHMTFCINSFCHYIGNQPYSSNNSARDSAIMALFTFGEGYHNFHHEFQSDYRNGVKAWQFDPTKWTIWALSKLGLAGDLRRVPEERILRAEISEHQRVIETAIQHQSIELPESLQNLMKSAHDQVQEAVSHWESQKKLYTAAAKKQVEESGKKLDDLRLRVSEATKQMRVAMEEWREAQKEIHQHLSRLANSGVPA
jgi:stearoyl-CoA desaturase (delta-9 desaturase)